MGKSSVLGLFVSLFAVHSMAQTGPTQPRFIMSRPPPQFDSVPTEAGLRTSVDLQVDANGRVTDVVVVKSSGSTSFDERAQKYYKKWRLMPAITAEGTPVASHLRTGFSLRGMGVAEDADKTFMTRGGDSDSPPDAAPEKLDPRVFDEPGRVLRMRCKDFLWEYDFLRKASGASAPFEFDVMPQTSLLEAAKRAAFPAQDYQKLRSGMNHLLRDAAKTCEARPDDLFVEQALVPVVKAQIGH